jgi:hypothetical protein
VLDHFSESAVHLSSPAIIVLVYKADEHENPLAFYSPILTPLTPASSPKRPFEHFL